MEQHFAQSEPNEEWEDVSDEECVEPFVGPNGQGWPKNDVPTEVVEHIVKYLSRDTLQNMRLVNREFERKVSSIAFKTVVVPFRSEIYGMMVCDSKLTPKPAKIDIKGKGKEVATPTDDEGDEIVAIGEYRKVKAKDIYDGMKVFEAWGSHIKQFAMTFEVDHGKHSLI